MPPDHVREFYVKIYLLVGQPKNKNAFMEMDATDRITFTDRFYEWLENES